MPLGDDQRQFFEGAVFDLFRGKEGKAAAAADRASHFRNKAERLDAKAERLQPAIAEATREEVAIETQRGQARVRMPQMVQLRRSLEDQAALIQEQGAALKASSEALEAMREEHAEFKERCIKAFKAIRSRMKQDQETFALVSGGMMALVNGLVSVINVSDQVQNPTLKVLEASLTGMAASDRMKGPAEDWIRIAALVANCGAYYDPSQGLSSLVTTDQAIPPEEVVEEPKTDDGIDWNTVADQIEADLGPIAAQAVRNQYGSVADMSLADLLASISSFEVAEPVVEPAA